MESHDDLRIISRASLDYIVTTLSTIASGTGRDLIDQLILITVGVSNVAYLNQERNRALSKQYAALENRVPDELQRPISRMQVAEILGLHRETARRRINALIEAGALVQSPDGLRASFETQNPERTAQLAQSNAMLLRRMVRTLREHGVEV